MKRVAHDSIDNLAAGPRRFLSAFGACVISRSLFAVQLAASMSGSLTKEQRDSMTPSQVIDELKKENERFRSGKTPPRDYLAEKRSSAAGQYPAAVIPGCVDSRVPAEIVVTRRNEPVDCCLNFIGGRPVGWRGGHAAWTSEPEVTGEPNES